MLYLQLQNSLNITSVQTNFRLQIIQYSPDFVLRCSMG